MPDNDPTPTPSTHFYVLLDRSGSMSSIADDVVGGLNTFVATQRETEPDARLTLVQFDGQDPHEVVLDATPISRVPPLPREAYQPRGNTPLLDATGLLAALATEEQAVRKAGNEPVEDVVFVTITDGHENASREFTLDDVRKLIKDLESRGWTFVFLSAALDAYGEAADLGYDARSVQSWAPDEGGAALAFSSLSESAIKRRHKRVQGVSFDRGDFFEGEKPAEEDRRRKGG